VTKLDSTQAQKRFPELLTRVGNSGERIAIEQEGQVVAAIVSYEDLKRLEALEDARDSEMMRRALAERDGEFVTLEEVIAHYNELRGTNFTLESIINDPD
jgi:prevent-host-death family protein